MALYLYRYGDGNEGNFPRFYVTLNDSECPYAAIRALMANRYIPGSKTRKHIMRECETDGEALHGICGTVYEGPSGETAFGAAWLTAELEPAKPEDVGKSNMQHFRSLREVLDPAAWRFYNANAHK